MVLKILTMLLANIPITLSNATLYNSTGKSPYTLVRNYTGQAFFDGFSFFNDTDPTHGFVQYVDMSTANETGLAGFATSELFENAIYLGVDYWSNNTIDGRPSTRVESKDTFNHSLWVADIRHMPGGTCGVWPAYWLLGTGSQWPGAGEIDIFEGINEQSNNLMTLHTDKNVAVVNITSTKYSNITQMTGKFTSLDCSLATAGTTGCSVQDHGNYGTDWNSKGGSVLVTEFTSQWIKIWNFPRSSVPLDIASGEPTPNTPDSAWGPPVAKFLSNDTNFDYHFFNLQLIFNIALCGDWVDKTWSSSECASLAPSCKEYVQNNPSVFTEAYWAIQGVQVYTANSSYTSNPTDVVWYSDAVISTRSARKFKA